MAPVASTLRTGPEWAATRLPAADAALAMLRPAARAYMVGYLIDALPTLFKQLLRFILVSMRNIAKVRKRIKMEKRAAREGDDEGGEAMKHGAAAAAAAAAGGSSSTPVRIQVPEATAQTSLYTDGIAPSLQQVPLLLKAMVRTILGAFGPNGVAAACAAAMAGTAVMDAILTDAIRRARSSSKGRGASSALSGREAVFSTFASAAMSSSMALYMLQRASVGADHDALKSNISISNPFRRRGQTMADPNNSLSVPTPLAPGGHFLARFTNLSVPTTPRGEKGGRSPSGSFSGLRGAALGKEEDSSVQSDKDTAAGMPGREELGTASPTIDLSLFALVRAMDTLVRGAPIMLALKGRSQGGMRPSSTAIGPAAGMKTSTTQNQLASARFDSQRGLISRLGQSLMNSVRKQADGLTFVVACAIIMFNWFYHPERLPPTYVRWISNLASMDHRALDALRCIRLQKPYRYGYGRKDTEPAGIDLLGSLSESLGHPYSWGDISRLPRTRAQARQERDQGSKAAIEAAKAAGRPLPEPYILDGATGPRGRGEMGGVPCEVIHCGVGGGNCFKNSLYRFLRAWKVCLGIYVPVHLLPRLLFGPGQFRKQPIDTITKVLKGSMRSATFLSTYIASIWFMVCMSRSVILPRLFPSVPFSFWDSGLGPILGSWTCGWSVFIEEPRKRAEMALYVAPRALFALAEMGRPGWLSRGQKSALQVERLLFGMSVGVVIAAARHRPDLLRGITALMAWVIAAPPRKGAAVATQRVRPTAPR